MSWREEGGRVPVNSSAGADVIEWLPEADIADFAAVPIGVSVVLLLTGVAGCVWAAALARFLDLTVVRPVWTESNLPCENVLYLLFSVAVADLLQAGCVLTKGVHILCGRWFLTLAFCKLWFLLDAAACAVRLWFLLIANVNLLGRPWSRTAKVTIVSGVWIMLSASTFVVMRAIGLRRDGLCGMCHLVSVPAAAIWRHTTTDTVALLLPPIAICVYFWSGRRLQVTADANGDVALETIAGDDELISEIREAVKIRKQPSRGTTLESVDEEKPLGEAVASTSGTPVQSDTSVRPKLRQIGKLRRFDTYTPSTFTLTKFWGQPTEDDASSTSTFSGLAANGGVAQTELDAAHRQDLTPEAAASVRRRVSHFVLVISLIHGLLSVLSGLSKGALDWGLTNDHTWKTAALVLDIGIQVQPLVTPFVFSFMFPRMYYVLRK